MRWYMYLVLTKSKISFLHRGIVLTLAITKLSEGVNVLSNCAQRGLPIKEWTKPFQQISFPNIVGASSLRSFVFRTF